MTERRPLAIVDGEQQEIPAGDVLPTSLVTDASGLGGALWTPTVVAAGESFRIPVDTQLMTVYPVKVDGHMIIDGHAILAEAGICCNTDTGGGGGGDGGSGPCGQNGSGYETVRVADLSSWEGLPFLGTDTDPSGPHPNTKPNVIQALRAHPEDPTGTYRLGPELDLDAPGHDLLLVSTTGAAFEPLQYAGDGCRVAAYYINTRAAIHYTTRAWAASLASDPAELWGLSGAGGLGPFVKSGGGSWSVEEFNALRLDVTQLYTFPNLQELTLTVVYGTVVAPLVEYVPLATLTSTSVVGGGVVGADNDAAGAISVLSDTADGTYIFASSVFVEGVGFPAPSQDRDRSVERFYLVLRLSAPANMATASIDEVTGIDVTIPPLLDQYAPNDPYYLVRKEDRLGPQQARDIELGPFLHPGGGTWTPAELTQFRFRLHVGGNPARVIKVRLKAVYKM